jgi:SAM-dependent methyltransferase
VKVAPDWDKAYRMHPQLATPVPWPHIVAILQAFPGESVYEVGFGSGMNLRWALDNGWSVAAGCEVAEAAIATGRELLPDSELKLESIVDCSAPSEAFDVVLDRAALSSLPARPLKKAIAQIRRILKPGGVFFFNPYSTFHTKPFPEYLPPQTLWTLETVKPLFPESRWETLESKITRYSFETDARGQLESTLRILVRKIDPSAPGKAYPPHVEVWPT